MLPEKPWRNEAVARLGVGIIVCQCLSAIAAAAMLYRNPEFSPWRFGAAAVGTIVFVALTLSSLRKPWTWDDLERRVLLTGFFFFGSLACAMTASLVAGKPGEPTVLRIIFAALSFQGALLALLPFFLRTHGITAREAFGFSINWKLSLLVGVIGAIIFFPVGKVLHNICADGIMRLGWTPTAQTAVNVLKESQTWPELLALSLITILLAPIAEEIGFRGILYPWLKRLGYPKIAFWGSSIVFALIHANLAAFLPLLLLSVLITRLYETTRNLLGPIAVHSLFNAMNFGLFLYQNRSFNGP